jgi:tellurite resistance protein TerC
MHSVGFWVGFHIFIVLLLAVDLKFFQGKVQFKRACLHSIFWVVLALLFNVLVYYMMGGQSGLQFFTGYVIEKSLSIDNLFLFISVFLHFQIPKSHQHKVLFWGILGALIFRIALILAGTALIVRFHWVTYALGAFIIFTAIHFCLQSKQKDPTERFLYRMFKKVLPVDEKGSEEEFFVKRRGKWKVTTLFLALLLIEMADVVFALDSIPAIFAITTDPFIVYTSNVFAVLGLRSHYFVLEGSLSKLYYYKFGLAAILAFVGAKMVLSDVIAISVPISLLVIVAIIAVTVFCSLSRGRKNFSL